MKTKKLSLLQHYELAKNLQNIYDYIQLLTVELSKVYNVSDPLIKLLEKNANFNFIVRVRSLLDDKYAKEHGRLNDPYFGGSWSYSYSSKKTGIVKNKKLIAYYEVACDPISDDYIPEETSAKELFDLWVEQVNNKYPNNLIPIYWFIQGPGDFEYMPYQYHNSNSENFLTYFTEPIDRYGYRIDWLQLDVVNKHWNRNQTDKGGFIQEYTGWKPSIYQPFVYLPSLLHN